MAGWIGCGQKKSDVQSFSRGSKRRSRHASDWVRIHEGSRVGIPTLNIIRDHIRDVLVDMSVEQFRRERRRFSWAEICSRNMPRTQRYLAHTRECQRVLFEAEEIRWSESGMMLLEARSPRRLQNLMLSTLPLGNLPVPAGYAEAQISRQKSFTVIDCHSSPTSVCVYRTNNDSSFSKRASQPQLLDVYFFLQKDPRSTALIIPIMFSMVKWRTPIQWTLDFQISGYVMNPISVGRGRFFKMFFVRPSLRMANARQFCHGDIYQGKREEETKIFVSEVTVSRTREVFLFYRTWTLS